MRKVLIVVDMQNDFVTGSLANPVAEKIVQSIADYIEGFEGNHIIVTRDTHKNNYLETYEGKKLPVTHCLLHTEGWQIVPEIQRALEKREHKGLIPLPISYVDKKTFGDAYEIAQSILYYVHSNYEIDTIEFVGTVTEICVISNVLGLKPYFPETDFVVHADMCAGLTSDGHEAALKVMQACQVKVI